MNKTETAPEPPSALTKRQFFCGLLASAIAAGAVPQIAAAVTPNPQNSIWTIDNMYFELPPAWDEPMRVLGAQKWKPVRQGFL